MVLVGGIRPVRLELIAKAEAALERFVGDEAVFHFFKKDQ